MDQQAIARASFAGKPKSTQILMRVIPFSKLVKESFLKILREHPSQLRSQITPVHLEETNHLFLHNQQQRGNFFLSNLFFFFNSLYD
jgi:hypothetical protein